MSRHAEPLLLLLLGLGLLVLSGLAPRDRFTWWLGEILVRRSPLRPGKWLITLVTAVALSISALYELVEWGAAVLTGEGAAAFRGTQGDPWDTQWDMFLALVGALTAQLLIGRLHDRHLARLGADKGVDGSGRSA